MVADSIDIDFACTRVAFGSAACFCALVCCVFVCFSDELVYLEPAERLVAGISAVALTTMLVLRATSQLERPTSVLPI